jgi:predicted nucleotidyltransferase
MMKKSHLILDVFVKNPTISYTFKEIKTNIQSNSESYTYNTLNSFVKDNILSKNKRGGVSFYKISNTSKANSYLSMIAEYKAWNMQNIPKETLYNLFRKINLNFFCLFVVGSYAKNKQTEKSDLDVILIVQDKTKEISSELRHFCEMSIPQIHLYVFTDSEFKQMLLSKKPNYGKEAVKNNLIFYGAQSYYKILFEVMDNGFSY